MNNRRDTRFRHLEKKVGVFFALAIIGCLAGLFFIGLQSDLFTSKYKLRFTVADGTGISEGMPIKLSGFRIGRVHSINLNQQAKVDVILQIDKEYQSWIHTDSKAKLIKEGLVGDMVVAIYPGTSGKPLQENEVLTSFETVKTLDQHVEEISAMIKPALTDLREFIRFINDPQGDIKKTLNNISVISSNPEAIRGGIGQQFTRTTDNLNQVILKSGELVNRSKQTIETLEGSLAEASQLINTIDTGMPGLLNRLEKTLANLEQISLELKQAAGKAGPMVPPLLERIDGIVEETGTLVNSAQNVWPLSSGISDEPSSILPGDSHE